MTVLSQNCKIDSFFPIPYVIAGKASLSKQRDNTMSKEYDPRMHSAEHILNQTMVRMFNRGRAFSSHLERKKSKCDYHFDRDLSPGEVREIESQVNSIIQSRKICTMKTSSPGRLNL